MKLRGTCADGQPVDRPGPTVTGGGTHVGEIRAFLTRYNGVGIGQSAQLPLGTVVTRDRFGLVTVRGTEYAIADIGMRMLQPRELFRAQGFPDSYVIDRGPDGLPLTKTAQIRLCGNSVPPQLAQAIVAANLLGEEVVAA
jgi:DNA (cytosine-5)-methyltransferase 1